MFRSVLLTACVLWYSALVCTDHFISFPPLFLSKLYIALACLPIRCLFPASVLWTNCTVHFCVLTNSVISRPVCWTLFVYLPIHFFSLRSLLNKLVLLQNLLRSQPTITNRRVFEGTVELILSRTFVLSSRLFFLALVLYIYYIHRYTIYIYIYVYMYLYYLHLYILYVDRISFFGKWLYSFFFTLTALLCLVPSLEVRHQTPNRFHIRLHCCCCSGGSPSLLPPSIHLCDI